MAAGLRSPPLGGGWRARAPKQPDHRIFVTEPKLQRCGKPVRVGVWLGSDTRLTRALAAPSLSPAGCGVPQKISGF